MRCRCCAFTFGCGTSVCSRFTSASAWHGRRCRRRAVASASPTWSAALDVRSGSRRWRWCRARIRCFPDRATIRTFDNKDFPSAGFYSQAVRCGPLVFLAGHIPIETSKPGNPVILGFARYPRGRPFSGHRSQPSRTAVRGRSRRRPGSPTSGSGTTLQRRAFR